MNKEKMLADNKKWKKENREKVNANKRKYNQEMKVAALAQYGNVCQCCGEDLLEGLTIDHIDGGGADHRRRIKKRNIYEWLRSNNYPPGFQVLCGTCNIAKGTKKFCPHNRTKGRLA